MGPLRICAYRHLDSQRLTHHGSPFFNVVLLNTPAFQQPPSVFSGNHHKHANRHCQRRAHRNAHVLHFRYSDVESLNESTKRLTGAARRALGAASNTLARYEDHDAVANKTFRGEFEFCGADENAKRMEEKRSALETE
jgi:hypothetical protein